MWFWLLDTLRIKFAIYKRTCLWLLLWLVLGIVLAIISIAVGGIGTGDINTRLIDGNILNMAAVSPNIGGFIWQRLLTIVLPVLLVATAALISKWTALIIFPFILMHGYWLCISFWWTWCYYSVNAIFLLVFYGFWLLMVTAVMIAGTLWALHLAAQIREANWQCRGYWWPVLRGLVIITAVSLALGILEYLVCICFLGRIVYKPL